MKAWVISKCSVFKEGNSEVDLNIIKMIWVDGEEILIKGT